MPRMIICNRTIVACSLSNFFAFGTWLAITYYLPLYWQAVEQLSAGAASVRLLPGIIAHVMGSLFAGAVSVWWRWIGWTVTDILIVDAKDREILLADRGMLFDIHAGRGPHHPLHRLGLTEHMGHMGWDRHLRIFPWHRGHKLLGGVKYELWFTMSFDAKLIRIFCSCLRRSRESSRRHSYAISFPFAGLRHRHFAVRGRDPACASGRRSRSLARPLRCRIRLTPCPNESGVHRHAGTGGAGDHPILLRASHTVEFFPGYDHGGGGHWTGFFHMWETTASITGRMTWLILEFGRFSFTGEKFFP